jgi:Tol biopolymer transport system component
MDADPSTDDAINISSATSRDYDPAWSPDGEKIAFASDRDGDFDIFVMDTDPSTDGATNLTSDRGEADSEPAWSPDGQRIAFSSTGGSESDIYVMDIDPSTNDATSLTDSLNRDVDRWPDWSPDGRKIAFARWQRDFYDEAVVYKIWVMNKDGSRQKILTDNGGGHSHLAWSPNGRKIAFVRDDPSPEFDSEIFVMRNDGSRQKRLTDNKRRDYAPDWQPIVP